MADNKTAGSDGAIGWAILAGIFAVILFLVWANAQYQIKSIIRWIRWGEMKIVSLFVGEDYSVRWQGTDVGFEAAMDQFAAMQAADLDSYYMSALGYIPMAPLKWPLILILMAMALWAYTSGPGTQFRRKLDLNGLIGVQSRVFPVISPFVKFNPSDQPPRAPGTPVPAELPLFAEALGPEEWLAYNEIPIPDGKVEEHAAYVAFARQLGPRWRGPMALAPYKQVLLAAFCLKAARKRKDGDDMLGRLAQCWSHDKGLRLSIDRTLLSDARKILRNRKLCEGVLSKSNQHAFETTAMLRALQTAREEGGVLAPAQFLWLRGHDRTLWYPLNNLGRQAFHMEALGAMCHFKAEKITRRPIPKPKVDHAVVSIAEYMSSPRARPIPQLDYSQSKTTRGVKQPKMAAMKKAPAKKPLKKRA